MSTSAVNAELQALRCAINGVDEALASLLVSRVVLSQRAQSLKAEAGLPALDAARETEIQLRYERHWRGAAAVARAILEFCRED